MKTLLMLLAAAFACTAASARPLVLEAKTPIIPPAIEFAVAGDELIGTTRTPIGSTSPQQYRTTATLYRRAADGQWLVDRILAEEDSPNTGFAVAMTSTVAAVSMPNGLRVWERTSSGWAESAVDPAARIHAESLDVVGNTILLMQGNCATEAPIVTRGANGSWSRTASLTSASSDFCIRSADLDEGRAILHVELVEQATSLAYIYERSGTTWSEVATLAPQGRNSEFFNAVALRGDLALVGASYDGTHVFRRTSAGWQFTGYILNPDSYSEGQADQSISISDGFVVKVGWNINRRAYVANVFRRTPDQGFEHVANIVAPNPNGIEDARISGNRVFAELGGRAYLIELPASFETPALVQEDFQTGFAEEWSPIPGTQYQMVNTGQTRVYRQLSLAGDAGAIHSADFGDQSVSADIRATNFNGADRWVGLISRYTDAGNYYYITYRSSNRLALRRMKNGVITELASYPLSANFQWHRFGLESSGTQQAVYVDGNLVMSVFDSTHSHGRAGIRTYKASADFDNVVVSPGPLASLTYTDRIATGGTWSANWPRTVDTVSQTNANSGDARALSGLPRQDVMVQTRLTFDSLSTTGTPWAGLIARYVDSRNYYYVTVRANEISLRKLTNGAISVLDNEPFTRVVGSPIDLRLEAIGDKLRVYVNDELRLEYAGAEVVAGRVGLMTYRAAATFSKYLAIEP